MSGPNGTARPRRRTEPLRAVRRTDGVSDPPPDGLTVAPAPAGAPASDTPEVEAVADRLLADPEAAPPSDGGRRGLAGQPILPLLILFGLNLVDELDRTAFGVLAPKIRDGLGLSITGITALAGVVGIIAYGLQAPLGFYADRFSRVRLALFGAAAWAFFSFGTGIAAGVVLLTATRVGSALGKIVNEPTHRSLLADYYPPEARSAAFYWHSAATSAGIVLAPVAAGATAYAFGWRAPFILFAVPTALLVALGAARLREPVRGRWERLAAGATGESALSEEARPSFGEAWRSIHQIRSLRRVLFSLPFLSVAFTGFVVLLSQFYEDRFGSNELEIGYIFSAVNAVQILGLVALIKVTARYIATEPRKVFLLIAAAAPIASAGYVGTSVAGSFTVSVVFLGVLSLAVAPLIGGVPALMSLVIPPRVRALGFGVGALYALPGFIILFWLGALAEQRSFTYAFVVMTPFLLLGTAILASGGRFVADDIERVRASARAQAEALLSRQRGEAKLLVARGVDVQTARASRRSSTPSRASSTRRVGRSCSTAATSRTCRPTRPSPSAS
jgi:branched-chain amino acid transport system ATP-binding protein